MLLTIFLSIVGIGFINAFAAAILILLIAPERFGLIRKLENLSLKIFKKRIDIQIICYLITLPFVIYFYLRPAS